MNKLSYKSKISIATNQIPNPSFLFHLTETPFVSIPISLLPLSLCTLTISLLFDDLNVKKPDQTQQKMNLVGFGVTDAMKSRFKEDKLQTSKVGQNDNDIFFSKEHIEHKCGFVILIYLFFIR